MREFIGHEVQIAQRFGLAGEVFRPIPFIEDLAGKGIAVAIAFGIKPCPGITVPVPGPAKVVARFQHGDIKIKLFQAVQ